MQNCANNTRIFTRECVILAIHNHTKYAAANKMPNEQNRGMYSEKKIESQFYVTASAKPHFNCGIFHSIIIPLAKRATEGVVLARTN